MKQLFVPPTKRIQSIDFVRGIIMIIMALDHTRDFFHSAALISKPLDPATTYPALFFTRWITHFCAPTFVFLSGLSAWLQGQRKTKKELQVFLITRGLWLILFDLTVLTLILMADIHFSVFMLETLWSIGAGMIILGLLINLPFRVILSIGLIIFFGHNLLDFAERSMSSGVPVWWKLLHQPGFIPLWQDHGLLVLYPFLSWAGLALLGYCCGRLFTDYEFAQRKKILVGMGVSLILLFIIIRAINVYGDPGHWQTQKTFMQTFYSFMNVQKYPPSLLFLCATMGPVLILLGILKNADNRFQRIITVFGRVPLFYFAVHLMILHAAQIIIYLTRHTLTEGMNGVKGALLKFSAPGEGYSLLAVYGIWISILILMYPLCKKYDQYKLNNKGKWWLSYL
jgi:uncharacterized membrane protein